MALYDPREFPEAETVSKDFTLADVLVWARTKPADEAYDYCSSHRCALAQFGIATGRPHLVGPDGTDLLLQRPALNDALAGSPLTFGAFADRLEQALAQ
jgi:hypothetical protein